MPDFQCENHQKVIDNFRDCMTKVKIDVTESKSQIGSLKHRVTDLETETAGIKEAQNDMKISISETKGKIENIGTGAEKDSKLINEAIASLKAEINSLISKIDTIKNDNSFKLRDLINFSGWIIALGITIWMKN
mgnify:CR=1 FL=1